MIRIRSNARNRATAAAAAGVIGVLLAASPAAAGSIGPNQYFAGNVNGHTTSPATIEMGCFGPVTPGETGHPLSGQYADVVPSPTSSANTNVGYTGASGRAIQISLILTNATISQFIALGTVSDYGTKVPIPTSLVLPCYGSGQASFAPLSGGYGARSATLTVNFVGQP